MLAGVRSASLGRLTGSLLDLAPRRQHRKPDRQSIERIARFSRGRSQSHPAVSAGTCQKFFGREFGERRPMGYHARRRRQG
jgi:hypothetical protein